MAGTLDPTYASTSATFAIGRQATLGTPRLSGLTRITGTQMNPKLAFQLSELGIEVGPGIISEQRSVKESFAPEVDINGHLRLGAMTMNLLNASGYSIVTEGVDPGSPVTTTLSAAVSSRFANTITVTSATGLNVGDWIQIAAPVTPGSPIASDRCEVTQIKSISSNTLTLQWDLLYTYANGSAVKKVDSAKQLTHTFYHIQPSAINAGGTDLWTVYMKFSNGLNTIEVLFYDGIVSSFTPNPQTGQIATFSSNMKFLNITRDPTTMSSVTTVADPSAAFVTQNSRASFNLLGDTVNLPKSVSVTLQTNTYDDVVLGSLFKQSNVITSHTLNLTTSARFNKAWWDSIIFGGSSNYVVSDAIPESSFLMTLAAASKVGTSNSVYSMSLNAPDCQFGGYDVSIDTNNPVMGNISGVKIVPSSSDISNERWYWTVVNNLPTGYASAA